MEEEWGGGGVGWRRSGVEEEWGEVPLKVKDQPVDVGPTSGGMAVSVMVTVLHRRGYLLTVYHLRETRDAVHNSAVFR